MQNRLMSNPNSPQTAQTKRSNTWKAVNGPEKCLTTNTKRNKCKQKCWKLSAHIESHSWAANSMWASVCVWVC